MDRYEINRQALAKPALLLLLATLLVSTVLWISGQFLAQHERDRLLARSRLDQLRSDYRAAVEAGEIINTSLSNYRNLQQRGFVGDEQRLLWIESLRISGNDSGLSGLQYSLKQQIPVEVRDSPGQYYRLFASDMELRLDLLHEGRLLDFFDHLEQQKPAVYQVKSCSLTSAVSASGLSLDMPNITAICRLRWFTVRDLDSLAEYTEDTF